MNKNEWNKKHTTTFLKLKIKIKIKMENKIIKNEFKML